MQDDDKNLSLEMVTPQKKEESSQAEVVQKIEGSVPHICSVYFKSSFVTCDAIVEIYINISNVYTGTWSWKCSWLGSNGFSRQEQEPESRKWIKAEIAIQETNLKVGESLTFRVCVLNLHGEGDSYEGEFKIIEEDCE